MKLFIPAIIFLTSLQSFAQSKLPFYYEQNMPLNGNPSKAEEFYYEYHTQAKAHYYHHKMDYDAMGNIKTHVKTNVGLVHPDSIPLQFKEIIDTIPITVTYSFKYDNVNRLTYFTKVTVNGKTETSRLAEEWVYDINDMLTQHNFYSIDSTGTTLKDPSLRRTIVRDASSKIRIIEKYTYNFAKQGLLLTETTEFIYASDLPDTINTYRITNGTAVLADKKYDIVYQRYDPVIADSSLFKSYTVKDQSNQVLFHSLTYDKSNRLTGSYTTALNGDTITKSEWLYEALKTTEYTDTRKIETFYDESGYERYQETFDSGSSLAKPADLNTRKLNNGNIEKALLEVWDPVTLFYRKDTEYFFYYDGTTGLGDAYGEVGQIQFYPNPSNGIVHLSHPETIQSLQLFATDGKTYVLPVASSFSINVPKGIYMLRASMQNATFQTAKIVIE